jgi:glycosyltransferase involved in cell wall biosynthesis
MARHAFGASGGPPAEFVYLGAGRRLDPCMSPLSVGVVTGSASRQAGGLFQSVRRLSQTLQAAGAQVSVYALRDTDSGLDAAEWGDLPPQLFDTLGPATLGFGRGMTGALLAGDHDLVHQHGIWQFLSCSVGAWRKRTDRPVVISPRGMLDPWAVNNSAWKKRLAAALFERANLSGASCIHALCDAERAAIRAYGISGPVAVVPNGVDPSMGDKPAPAPSWAGSIPDGAKVMLFLSRIHPKKGLAILIEAMAAAAGPDAACWHLAVAGWDQNGHQAELEALVEARGLARRVHFVGPMFGEEKRASLAAADAFVLPSFSEGLPMAVLEAWAFRLPVLMTPQCNLPEGAGHSAAIEVQPTVADMTDGLLRLTGMAEDGLREMGRNGRALVEAQFSWNTIGNQMFDVYRWASDGGATPTWVEAGDG